MQKKNKQTLDLKYKIIRYQRISLHKLMHQMLYPLLKNYVEEYDDKEAQNFKKVIFEPIKVEIISIDAIIKTVVDSSSYLKSLLFQEKYIQFLRDYQIHLYLNGLAPKEDVENKTVIENCLTNYAEAEAHRVVILLLDKYDEKKLSNIIESLYTKLNTFDHQFLKNYEDIFSNVFINKLYILLYCFFYNKSIDDIDYGELVYDLDSTKREIANNNLLKFLEKKSIFTHQITETNLFDFFELKYNIIKDTFPLDNNDSMYEKIINGIDSFLITKYNTKSQNIRKLKEVLQSDYLFCPRQSEQYDTKIIQETSDYTYYFFTKAIIRFILSDDIVRYKHSYDLRRKETKDTFIKKIENKIKDDFYFVKSHYNLVLKYLNDYKRRESLFLIHLCYYMCIMPSEALQICKALGFYEHKSKKKALENFNEDIVKLYLNFELLKGTSFFVKNEL